MERPSVYLDTNVFISAMETSDLVGDNAWRLFRAAEAKRIRIATSELTLAELLVKPLRDGNSDLASAYEAMITPSDEMMVVTVDRDVIVDAARLRADRPAVKLPDAIHVASARRAGCKVFVTQDKFMPQTPGIELIEVGPALESILKDRS